MCKPGGIAAAGPALGEIGGCSRQLGFIGVGSHVPKVQDELDFIGVGSHVPKVQDDEG